MEIWGNPIRAHLFEYIRTNPDLVFGQIYEGFRGTAELLTGKNFIPQNLARHLRVMRQSGVIKTSLPDNLLQGRSPQYAVDAEKSDAMIDAVVSFVDGYRSQSRKR